MPALGSRIPMMTSTSSAWPLPSTPAMPEDLAGVDGERDVVEERAAAPSPPPRTRPSTRSRTRSVTVDSSVVGDGSSLPTISSASWRALTLAGSTVSMVVPRRMTVISSATVSTSSSLCEMNMTVRPSSLSSAQLLEQLVDLLRHEHGGRLVEDQRLGAAVEDLEDLDALPVADAEVGRPGRRGRRRARRPSEIRAISARARSPMPCSFSAPRTTFSSTVRLSASMKCWYTMPMPARWRRRASAG